MKKVMETAKFIAWDNGSDELILTYKEDDTKIRIVSELSGGFVIRHRYADVEMSLVTRNDLPGVKYCQRKDKNE